MNIQTERFSAGRPHPASPKVDGRRARSEDSRRKIVAATIDLVAEGQPSPTAEAVATRANVSLRTVFRHFEEMDNLYQEIAAAVFERVRPYVEAPLPRGDWPTLLEGILQRRAEFFEQIRAFKTAIDVHRHRSPAVLVQHQRIADISRELLERTVPEPIRKDHTAMEMLTLLLSIESWQRLIEQQGLAPADAIAMLRQTILALTADRIPT